MKKLLLIVLCFPLIGFGQEKSEIKQLINNNSIVIDTGLVKLKDLAPEIMLTDPIFANEEDVSKSSTMHFPYPVIFIHHLIPLLTLRLYLGMHI